MILNGIQVLQLTSDPFAGIPAIEPPQQPTKLLDPLLATRVSLIVKETIADRHLRVAWRVTSSNGSLALLSHGAFNNHLDALNIISL
jgi:hypothetical protein